MSFPLRGGLLVAVLTVPDRPRSRERCPLIRRACRLSLLISLFLNVASYAAPGSATLRLTFDKTCYKPGDTVTASLIMENVGSPAAGFQAFLQFDNAKLQFVSGS